MLKKTFSIVNLGCPKNTVDSEIIKGNLIRHSFQFREEASEADTVIINTCGFLDKSREESIDTILEVAELKKSGRLKKLLVAGCLSERYPDELRAELPEVDQFFGANTMKNVVEYMTGKHFLAYDPTLWRSLLTPPHYAYFKIAEGCDNVCSFCAIPGMRGRQVSKTVDALLREASMLAEKGVRELMLIAQDLSTYGYDLNPKVSLTQLLRELDQVEGINWIRLHYLHPSHIGPELIPFLASGPKRILPYIDMPLQHSSSRLLKMMKRGLDGPGISRLLSRMRQEIPGLSLRTAMIVGFPGETEEEFRELADFVKEQRFERLGVFTYSEEEGTSAAELTDDVPPELKEARQAELMEIQQAINLQHNESLIGTVQTVLIDSYNEAENISYGRTYRDSPEIDNQVLVRSELPVGEFSRVRITGAMEYDLLADPADSAD